MVHRQTNTAISPVSARPMTEMMVFITDHVLIVCPTVIPKYCCTSQKPASLTCEKNSEPAPMASTTRASWTGDRPAASGTTMPAAVMVATVAEPVAGRISTATNQPSTSTDKVVASAILAIAVPAPPTTRICLNPPPAPTIRVGPAIGGSDSPIFLVSMAGRKPTPPPEGAQFRRNPQGQA